jgi:thiol:disulfide interchange protein DsbA
MDIMRRLLLVLGMILITATGLAGAVELKEGQQYTVFNPPKATENSDKIEITEFFWYGCGHCYHLDPALIKWVKKLPKDVVFRRVPAVFPGRDGGPGSWAPGAKLYYSMEAMGLLDKLHSEVFDAIHAERTNLLNEKVMLEWLGKKGVDTAKFADIYQSFAVQSKISRSMQLSQAHGLDGVPALIVDGHYKLASAENEDLLAALDQLIDKVRKERGVKK